MNIIETIRKEIISRINKRHLSVQAQNELVSILSFLDILKEKLEKPINLDYAAEISFDEAKSLTEDYMDFLAKGLIENKPRPIGPHWFCEYAKKRFKVGAEWAKEQIMKGTIEVDYTLKD